MVPFQTYERNKLKSQLQEKTFDLLVIGGGITGAGIALDAAHRGLRTALVEMQDFAAGTSSRSTKLIHGGLRYLKQLEFQLVAEVGRERAIVYENGPHVTEPEWLMLPFYKGGTLGRRSTRVGLTLYDFLAQVKKDERHKMFNPIETSEKAPLLEKANLLGAGYYIEYKTDDARLTIEVLKKAVELGTIASNYMKVIDLIYDSGKITGVIVQDGLTNASFPVYAKKIVNATGPWVDSLREIDGSKEKKSLYITKGVHLVFEQSRFPLKQAIYFDTQDGRMIFAIPREGKTYVGTTDTPYDGDLMKPDVTKEDCDYLLEAVNSIFPTLQLTRDDVESSWVGLRPLIAEDGKKPGEISRKNEIFIAPSGLLSIAGGKLTGYRKMAEKIVDIITNQLQQEEGIVYQKSETKSLPISGGDVGGSGKFPLFKEKKLSQAKQLGISKPVAERLVKRYGSNVDFLFELYEKMSQIEKIDRIFLTELNYAIEYEAVIKPVDFFIRRTGMLFFNVDEVENYKESVMDFMAKKLSWSNEQKLTFAIELDEEIFRAKMESK